MAFVSFTFLGVQYYLIRRQFGESFRIKDMILFPIVMNLWGFVIPFQGSLLFRTVFFVKKYNMRISESFSISFYLFLVILSFTGVFGILFTIYNDLLFSWVFFVSVLFLINPIIIVFSNTILSKLGNTSYEMVNRVRSFIQSMVGNMSMLFVNVKFTLLIFAVSILHYMFSILWYYWISFALGFDLSFVAVGLISSLMSISLIFKVTPGNLGVAQLVTGGFMGLAGTSPEEAVLITLFATANILVLAFTIGLAGNFYYFKTLNILKIEKP